MSDVRISELESQVETLQRRNGELEAKIQQAETAAERATVAGRLRLEALQAGVVAGAVEDVVSRAMRTGEWKLSTQGKLVRYENGVPDVTPAGDYTTKNFFAALKKSDGYYFQNAQEAAAKSSNGETNPWMPHSWNLTQQGRVLSMSKSDAERMAKEAGVPLYSTQPKSTK